MNHDCDHDEIFIFVYRFDCIYTVVIKISDDFYRKAAQYFN